MTLSSAPPRRRANLAMLVDYFEGEYQMGLVEAAAPVARRLGYHLCVVVGRSLGAPEPYNLIQNDIYTHIDPCSIDGIVVGAGCIGIYQSPEAIAGYCKRFWPIPLCSVSTQLPGIPSLVVSNRRGMQMPVDHLIEEHNCQRIAYIRGPLASEEAEERFQGYCDSLRCHGIAFDPTLIEVGNFWIDSGNEATKRLLNRGAAFDAIVAANDYMALGAMAVLKTRGIRVPHTVRVAGFDDVQSAILASPSLTTVRQPLRALGKLAIESLHDCLRGVTLPLRRELDVELITRQSCGCGYRVRPVNSSSFGLPRLMHPVILEIVESRATIVHRLTRHTEIPAGSLSGWAERLITALTDELHGHNGRFLLELEDLLDEAQPDSYLIERFYTAILVLRTELSGLSTEGSAIAVLDDIWHGALLLISDATRRSHLSSKRDAELAFITIRDTIERLSTALSKPQLAKSLNLVLNQGHIRSGAVSLYTDSDRKEMQPLVAASPDMDGEPETASFAASELAPPRFFETPLPRTFVVMPLVFGTEHEGIAVFETGAHNSIYMMLREQIGAVLKGAALHQTVVHQTALRERAEREQLEKETAIAQQIQTAMLPRNARVEGFQTAARMLPAASVGGDYYDVIPVDDGVWFGFGDVTGHGLLAGLIMLMIQSMVASAIASDPEASPRHLVTSINRSMFENIRYRLGRDDYATFTLLHCTCDGRLALAGAHETLLILRAETGRCEQIAALGFWLGAVQDVDGLTVERQERLGRGDCLVLYSDGITESMNADHEQFGLTRLMQLLEQHGSDTPDEICDAAIAAAQNWSIEQLDDMTILVARYTG